MSTFVKDYKELQSYNIPAQWFIYNNDEMLLKKNEDGELVFPVTEEVIDITTKLTAIQYIGELNGQACIAAYSQESLNHKNLSFCNLRQLFYGLPPELVHVAGYASHLVKWDVNSTFCGKCGTETERMKNERAKKCPSCESVTYPRISPAVIVAVLKDDKILLARSPRFRNKMYSVLAGFVDVGESLEDCIHREIKEEVNLEVENIRYFGSQPWPFPDSLMVGYIADYKSGEIKVDGIEIADAGWYTKDNLPEIPTTISIAGELIEWFKNY